MAITNPLDITGIPATIIPRAMLIYWMAHELGVEGDRGIKKHNIPDMDDAVLDALGLAVMYLSTLDRNELTFAIDEYRFAQRRRNRSPVAIVEEVIDLIAQRMPALQHQTQAVIESLLTQEKSAPFLTQALISWNDSRTWPEQDAIP